MQVELNLPLSLERKIRALHILLDSSDPMDDIVVELMDRAVSECIKGIVDGEREETPVASPSPYVEEAPKPFRSPPPRFRPPPRFNSQGGGPNLEDGLGDDIPEDIDEEVPQPVKDMYDLIPKGSKKALEEMEREMDIEDPEHEAKASAGDVMNPLHEGGAQEMFSQMMGLPTMADQEPVEVDPRIAKRKKRLNIKGKVTPATEVSESF